MLEHELKKLGHNILSSGADPPTWEEVAAMAELASKQLPAEQSVSLLIMLSHLRAKVEGS